jgi:integrase
VITRPLDIEEYQKIINFLLTGFITSNGSVFRPKPKIALALQLQATLGLRIGDVLALRVKNFKNGKLETLEKKTGKLQYREINQAVFEAVYGFAIENKLASGDKLFTFKVRDVQHNLKLVTQCLELDNISTHSFRKMFALSVYMGNNNNLELVKELLNHTSIATTQRYIRVSQREINDASRAVNFLVNNV